MPGTGHLINHKKILLDKQALDEAKKAVACPYCASTKFIKKGVREKKHEPELGPKK